MTIIAYLYSDPLLESPADPAMWGVEIDRIYQDLGKRDSLQKLIQDCQQNPPNYLLIRCLDELGDNLAEVGDRLAAIEALGISVVAISQPYTSDRFNEADSRYLQANLGKILQEVNKNQQSRRLRRGHARNRLKTLPPPGKPPYGYRRGKDKYIIDRATAPVVKDFFERFLLFGSLRGAVRYLEKRYGKKIAPSTGLRWLTNPVYRGNLAYQNGEIILNTHVAIVSAEEAAQIDRLLRRNSRLPSRTASAPRSLAGLFVCQQCQSRMTITRVTRRDKKQEYLYLRPINCTARPKCSAISYQDILEKTIERICQDLPRTVAEIELPNIEALKGLLTAEIKKKQAIIEQLPSLVERGILDRETVQLRSYKLRTEIAKLEAKIAQLPPVNLQTIAATVSIPQFWFDLSESERRFYFREFISQIELIRTDPKNWDLQLVFIF